MQIRQRTAIFFSGTLWFLVGCMLMMKGIHLLMEAGKGNPETYPLIKFLLPLAGFAKQAVLALVAVSLLLGTMKGRTVLTKAARRLIDRFQQMPNPLPLKNIYPLRYYILLGCMMSLGFIRRLTGIADDIGGVVDLTIGCALIQGALVYYRAMNDKPITCDTGAGDKS